MKKFLLFIIVFIYCLSFSYSATLYSRASGAWATNGTWSTSSHAGLSCNCTPGNSDVVIIANGHTVNYSAKITIGSGGSAPATVTVMSGGFLTGNGSSDIEVKTGGTLTIHGTVTTRDIEFANGSIINVSSTGQLIVTGNLTNNNNSNNVTFDGSISVEGDFFNGNGGDISGNGSLSVNGTTINNGTTFGCSGPNCCVGNPCTYSNALPIELLSFEGIPEKDKVILKWATASEINNDYFTIERTSNGQDFEIIGNVKGAGNSNSVLKYTSNDDKPLNGTSYYRLKQTDFDGTFSYSELIPIKTNLKNEVSLNVFPNPVTAGDPLSITVSGETNEEVLVVVVDRLGNEYFSKVVVLDETEKVIAVDPYQRLVPGLYIITSSKNDGLRNKKLIVK